MADAGIFISWGGLARGRERQANQVYQDAIKYFQGLKAGGKVEEFKSHVVLTGNTALLNGFFLLEGTAAGLAAIQAAPEFAMLVNKGQMVVDNFTLDLTLTAGDPMQLAQMAIGLTEQATKEIGG